jgi:hypothetical protein
MLSAPVESCHAEDRTGLSRRVAGEIVYKVALKYFAQSDDKTDIVALGKAAECFRRRLGRWLRPRRLCPRLSRVGPARHTLDFLSVLTV